MRKPIMLVIIAMLLVMLNPLTEKRRLPSALPEGPITLSYLYGSSKQQTYANNILRTNGCLTVVHADYFHIDQNGDAAISKTPDKQFIQTMQQNGVRVCAFVSNHWDDIAGRKAMAKRASVAQTLAGWVEQYGLDGLDIDIENLNHDDKNDFTDFVRLTRQFLPSDKLLFAAVAANPYKFTVGWRGQYDYAALGQICNYIMLMSYDQSFFDSEPGPVASYAFTEMSVKEALKHIPKKKLLMGLPFYGRYWAAYDSGTSVKGKAFTINDIETITKQYTSTTWYDSANECARASVTVKKNDSAANMPGGKILATGTYDIWYENERSLAARMKLCKKYGLAGVGSWSLGQEPEHIWKSWRLWLRGIPFTDIAGHWAEQAVAELYELGILNGVGGGLSAPEAPVTRAEVCVFLCRLLGINASGTAVPAEIKNHWASGWLNASIHAGLLRGDGTSYRPDDPVTRAELAVLCERGLQPPSTIDYTAFSDVKPSDWFYGSVAALSTLDVLNGLPDGRFNPEGGASRAETAKVIWKMLSVETKTFAAGT